MLCLWRTLAERVAELNGHIAEHNRRSEEQSGHVADQNGRFVERADILQIITDTLHS